MFKLLGHKRGERKQRLAAHAANAAKKPPQSRASSQGGTKRVAPPNVQDYTKMHNTQVSTSNAQATSTGMGKISLISMGFNTPNVEPNYKMIEPYAQPTTADYSSGLERPKNVAATNGANNNIRKHSSEAENNQNDDINLEIGDNPDESGTDTNEEEINSIIEYQHKILRKYALNGLIRYYDASFFHDMVIKRDYKMISIFEVFAINRNEDDFLENLFIFKELVNEEDQMNERRQQELVAQQLQQLDLEGRFPNLRTLN